MSQGPARRYRLIPCKDNKDLTRNATTIIPLCKHVVAKVTLVPCAVNLTGKRDKGGHVGATINNAMIISYLWQLDTIVISNLLLPVDIFFFFFFFYSFNDFENMKINSINTCTVIHVGRTFK